MGRAIETVLLVTASASIGAACMYFYLGYKTVETANTSLVTANKELKDAAPSIAREVLALSKITQRNQALIDGLKQHENLLKRLEDCPVPAELGRLFSLQAEAINAANRAGSSQSREDQVRVRKPGAGD